jgi:hypothetical protein
MCGGGKGKESKNNGLGGNSAAYLDGHKLLMGIENIGRGKNGSLPNAHAHP